MATPRPPGVRRASVFEERLARAANILPAFRPLKSLWGSGFTPLAFARSASPTFWLSYARQNVAGRDRYVQYELQYLGLLQHARASGRRAQSVN